MFRRVGLFFGSFNPIHVGHLIIANTFVERTDLDEVWFVVSPQNPMKQQQSLLADYHRVEMVRRAVEGNDKLRVCDAELHLPTPSYTVLTLAHLGEHYRDKEFALIMGGDNLASLDRWRNFEFILEHYMIYVYPRPGYTECALQKHPHVRMVDVPMMDVSSSDVRQRIRNGESVQYLLTEPVHRYLREMHFYETKGRQKAL
ncbi:MAG: nicotinate-nucleotide adenylyltransferase [bacterium P3]|nr:MAG: nicotinate-nucleotide adenylyltransferase [bacterium P3]KWW40946.1 MAG: nicotinate-nucleotide adenylyltransferase [bacterium F083]